jgi:hypothetical protein
MIERMFISGYEILVVGFFACNIGYFAV